MSEAAKSKQEDDSAPVEPSAISKKLEKIRALFRISTYLPMGRKLGPLEKVFVGCMGSLVLICALSLVYGVMLFRKTSVDGELESAHSKHEEEASEHEAEHVESHESAHGEAGVEDESILTQNAIPKSIRDREDGVLDPGQDLIEPEIESNRSISSVLKNKLQVEGPPKYVEITEILAGARSSSSGDAVMLGDIVLVMSDYEGQQEAGTKSTELKALVTALVADLSKDELRSFAGKVKLKNQIQREVNHLLKKGEVKDILFSKFLIR